MFTAMQQRIREAREEQSGFTLIELLIVIVILGVLAGIVVFAVSAFNGDGKAAACKADYKNVEIASEAFYAKRGQSATGVGTTLAANPATDTTLVGAGYLKEPPGNSATSGYTITFTAAAPVGSGSGTVTATGACTLP
jgi:prepilin-type N-terminal cleavage/methylation domain-containing protein